MRKRRNKLAGLAMMMGVLMLGTGSAYAVVEGVVLDDAFVPISDATVEFWDSYPGGTVLATTMSAADGSYSLDPGAAVTVGVIRAFKNQTFPSVTQDVPNPSEAVGVALKRWQWIPAQHQTSTNCDFWDTESEFLGYPLQLGDVVTILDPEDNICGQAFLTDLAAEYQEGGYVVHVFGDDGTTTATDEGAESGDTLSVRINNVPAIPADSSLVWQDRQFFKRPIKTDASTTRQGVRVVGPLGVGAQAGSPIALQYDVTNTGNSSDVFDLFPFSPDGWAVSVVGDPQISLATGATDQVSVLVEVPPLSELSPADIAAEIHAVFLAAVSQTNSVAIGLGIGTVSVEPTDVNDPGGSLPRSYGLSQNYPNPFNPSTVIEFMLERPTQIKLTVYNVLGREVATLAEGVYEPGQHVVVFDASNSTSVISSGVYFYRLETPSETLTRKMVLMK